MCPPWGETTVFIRHLVLAILYGSLSGMQGRPKHVEKRNKRTKKNYVPNWLYFQDCIGMHCQQNIKLRRSMFTGRYRLNPVYMYIYRVSQEKCTRLRENVPYVKVYRYNPKHLYPELNGYGDNGQRNLKLWQLLHTYWFYQIHIKTGRNMWFL